MATTVPKVLHPDKSNLFKNLFSVTFAENDPVTAGSNSESIAHVREMIGLNSRSLVLATPNHYKALINKFGFCGYNRTWSDPNSMTVNSLIIKNIPFNELLLNLLIEILNKVDLLVDKTTLFIFGVS